MANCARNEQRGSAQNQGYSMNIVITGSTKGIGLGMAREFLRRGHNVVVSSRGQQAVTRAMELLGNDSLPGRIAGQPCDVGQFAQVQSLWDTCASEFGSVDIWVNNAGRDSDKQLFRELAPEDYVATVNTNLIGVMHCNRVAIAGMQQQGSGWVWNMEGFGSDGRTMAKYAPYGSTKYALRYFTKIMIEECKDTPVKIGYLSPGMVVTELLIEPGSANDPDWARRRKFFNIVADTVDTVTPWLVEGMLNAKDNGAAVRWLTTGKIARRFLVSIFKKRDILTPLGM